MNQMIGLEEIFVLSSSKLFAGSPKLRECFLHGKGNNAKIIHNGTNEQNKRNHYWNNQVHPPSILSKLFSGKQKSWKTFLEGREDDETIPRQSIFKHPLNMKANLNSKSFRFPHTRLLLGLYDYRFKHLAIMEQEDCDVITIFQTNGLAKLFGSEKLESRTTPFQEGEDDMTTPASKMSQALSQATTTQVLPTPTPAQVIKGPVTRSHAKKLQQEVHALLCEVHFNINKNYILSKCSTLIVLRYI